MNFTRFKNCNLYKSLFLEVDICNSGLYNCDLESSEFENSRAIDLHFTNVQTRYAKIPLNIISGCTLYDTDISRIENSRYIGISGIGSAKRVTFYCLDTKKIKCGCFTGTIKEFKKEIKKNS